MDSVAAADSNSTILAKHEATGSSEQDIAAQYLQSLLATYMVQPNAALLAAQQQQQQAAALQQAQQQQQDADTMMMLQHTIAAAVANPVSPALSQLSMAQPHLAVLQQGPSLAATDALQFAALLAAMQDPSTQQRWADHSHTAILHCISPLRLCCPLHGKAAADLAGARPHTLQHFTQQRASLKPRTQTSNTSTADTTA